MPRVIVTDPASVAVQTINDGLGLAQSEWFLDTSAGFPWFSFLGKKIFNTNQLQSALRTFLSSVPGIVGILVLDATFDGAARSFSYKYALTFNSGAIITGGSGVPATVQAAS